MSNVQKVALVTGGNRGIGYELVKQLAMKGLKVILASRDSESGRVAAQKLLDSKLDVAFVELDVDNQENIQLAAKHVTEQYGRLDVLINNAGVYLEDNKHLVESDPAIFEKTMSTNFMGAYRVIRSFFPLMEKGGYGRIINISSDYGALSQLSYPGVGAYKLSKFALNGLTQMLAAEFKGNGDFKINAADPGWVSSDMGGPSAPRTPKQAAESILWLATIGPEGPNGGFFRDGERVEW